ncbi:alanine dehydrogenase [Desulfuromonas acetoxidans]|uniref:alanine dehydrogenase n=1 Tax=Desulfuromonas acetoxidans TaxID=891 RepID=UPI00292F2055|nr:alanine dehydrogenase [Desulfuromonas acetoxidans]
MNIAVAKEIKNNEYRVAMTAEGVARLTGLGHHVSVEQNAGAGSGISDSDYLNAGAHIAFDRAELFQRADLIVKVKEPQPEELPLLKAGQTLFTYLHLAALPDLTRQLLDKGITAIGYETVTAPHGTLPLLHPMSLIAGRLAVQTGASLLEKNHGGQGILLSGAPGAGRGRVVILGAGTVGENAVEIAVGMGAEVVVLNRSARRLEQLEQRYASRITTHILSEKTLHEQTRQADLLIGAVLVPGAKAPQLVSRDMVAAMKPGSVIVDVAIDQGGCVETIRPTSHDNPTYIAHDVIHYAVTNIPGAVARTSTLALTGRTLAFIEQLAAHGTEQACRRNPHLANGVNVHDGILYNRQVAEAHSLKSAPLASWLATPHS